MPSRASSRSKFSDAVSGARGTGGGAAVTVVVTGAGFGAGGGTTVVILNVAGSSPVTHPKGQRAFVAFTEYEPGTFYTGGRPNDVSAINGTCARGMTARYEPN
jgi:hypothetical protein